MKKTTLKLATTLFLIAAGLKLEAQNEISPKVNTFDYNNAIGVRLGETSGLSFKHKFSNHNALEAIVSFWPYTIGLTGLYEYHHTTGAPGLNWYVGGGGHINAGRMYSNYYFYNRGDRYVYVQRRDAIAVGIDGVLGLEYKFRPVPFAISADIKPFVETTSYGYIYTSIDPSIGLKFTF